MLGISINGEFLDLAPRTSVTMERVSPFFSNDDLAAEYSLPLTFPYTPKNARLLGLQNHFYTKRKKKTIAASLYDNNNFSYSGDLVIQSADLDINNVERSQISGYFLNGVSPFFQKVKNVKLKDLTLGGLRTFAWTNKDPLSSAKGFWQHIHDTWSGAFPYVFDPIRNEKWAGSSDEGTPSWMNKLGDDGYLDYDNNFNTLAPQIFIKYVLEQIFAEHGWDLDYTAMNDEAWQLLIMPSFYAVEWQKIVKVNNNQGFDYAPLPTITINLADHMPPEMAITDFVMALRNRYNWGFDFDSTRKVCTMFPLKNLTGGKKKDWTQYMTTKLTSDFSEDEKVFAFKNETDSNDSLQSGLNLDTVKLGDNVFNTAALPLASEDNFNLVIYCWFENKYYQCTYDEDAKEYSWTVFGDNVYEFTPEGNNETITTVCSTMPVYKTLIRDEIINQYYGYFPMCEQEGNWKGKQGEFVPWGLRTLFHRGMVYEINQLGLTGTKKYPYATSLAMTPSQSEPDLQWSNVYVHKLDTLAQASRQDLGIINYWWKETNEYRKNTDVTKGALMLPRQELINFRWGNVILLKNIPYIVQKITEVIPYSSVVQVELIRIG